MISDDRDAVIRQQAFDFLARLTDIHGEELPRSALAQGFQFQGERVPLVGPQGIFKPRILELPLSLTTTPRGPYQDSFVGDWIEYAYRGTDPQHRDNVGMRRAWQLQKPLIYLFGIAPGRYLAAWPVYIVADDPGQLKVSLSVDSREQLIPDQVADESDSRRRYITASIKVRAHQGKFRDRVLAAYRQRCSICQLAHRDLLDAAHIVPDAEGGEPTVSNGLALCKLHHAAFDSNIMGIRPDYQIEIRRDILEEVDGPMLRHGLQGMQGQIIRVPDKSEQKPNTDALEERYQRFLRAG